MKANGFTACRGSAGREETIDNQSHTFRAVGIDPGLAQTGYAVVETLPKGGHLCEFGNIKTMSDRPVPERLQTIFQKIDQVVRQWLPSVLVIEEVFMYDKFPSGAIQLGEVKGVISLAAQHSHVEVMRISPTEVKSCLTGKGRATKQQVGAAVVRMLGLKKPIRPDHASDAAALAIMGLSRKGYYIW